MPTKKDFTEYSFRPDEGRSAPERSRFRTAKADEVVSNWRPLRSVFYLIGCFVTPLLTPATAPFFLLEEAKWAYARDTVFQEQAVRMYAFIDYKNEENDVHFVWEACLFLAAETGSILGRQAYLTANGAPCL